MPYSKYEKINVVDPHGKITTHFILALTENGALFLSGYIDIIPPSTPIHYEIITSFGDIPTTEKIIVAVNTLTNESNQIGVNCKLQTNKMILQLTSDLAKYPRIRLSFSWVIPIS